MILLTDCLKGERPSVRQRFDPRLEKAYKNIQRLESEKENTERKMADMAKYIGYLESIMRTLPRPI